MYWLIAVAAMAAFIKMFVLLSARNTRFFVHRLAAHAAGLEAYKDTYGKNIELLEEYEQNRQEALEKQRKNTQRWRRRPGCN